MPLHAGAIVAGAHGSLCWHKTRAYEIQSALGAGGLGEVYRARDTGLDRTVAVKILPAHLSSTAICTTSARASSIPATT
jgi:serine/threonine protein kinase